MLNSKLKNNNKRVSGRIKYSGRDLTSNIMRRETIAPLVIGLLLGALFVVFFQFNNRLNNNTIMLNQLEQATASNTKNVSDVISFINNATKGQAAANTPAATTPAQ
jgi:hypothetical protein